MVVWEGLKNSWEKKRSERQRRKGKIYPTETSLVGQMVKRLPAMWETWVWSLSQEDPLEKEMAPHSSTLAWKIPWMEESGRLQSTGSQRVGHDWATSLSFPFFTTRAIWEAQRRLLRFPWTARSSDQSILKEINPEYSLEGLMLKLKLQYFGHSMQRTYSLEKTLMLGNIEGKRRSR